MNKKIIWLVVIAILIVAAYGLYLAYQSSQLSQKQTNQYGSTQNNQNTTSNQTVKNETTTVPSASTLSYSTALRLYVNKRIQFDQNCTATPNNMTFKKGTAIMLDNRSSTARTISLGGRAYWLKAYGFAIATVTTTAPLPHTVKVDCGSEKNNATIYLQ